MTDGTNAYVTYPTLRLGAIDAATGKTIWSVAADAADGGIVPYPLADATRVYASGVHGVWAFVR